MMVHYVTATHHAAKSRGGERERHELAKFFAMTEAEKYANELTGWLDVRIDSRDEPAEAQHEAHRALAGA